MDASCLRRAVFIACFASLAGELYATEHVFKKREGEALDPARHRRLAVLVVRVGAEKCIVPPPAISTATDYSARQPKAGKVDVWIEDDARARASLPLYPKYKSNRIPAIRGSYFRNITPQLHQGIEALLRGRGFEVQDVHEVARAWPKPVSESTVAEVIQGLSGTADAILILHYRDLADYTYNSIRSWRTEKGFAGIGYTLTAFEVPSQRRILVVKSDQSSPTGAASFDPAPELRGKVRTETLADGSEAMWIALSDDEMIALAVRYVVQGVRFVHPVVGEIVWHGLAELLF